MKDMIDILTALQDSDSQRMNSNTAAREGYARMRNDALDALYKRAQIMESGYNIDRFGNLSQRPDYVSLKDLQRRKMERELDPNYEAEQAAAKEAAIIKARKDAFGNASGSMNAPSPFGAGMGDGSGVKEYMDSQGKVHLIKDPYAKPLSDTAASKLSAAKQSLENIRAVKEMATPEKFNELKSGFGKIRMGNRLGVTNPESVMGNALNTITFGAARLPFQTTDEQKRFENNLSTLIEGQLRARTGAAAPQAEIDREVSRILASDDTLNSFLSKLSNAERFVLGISRGIRPGLEQEEDPIVKTGVDEETGQPVGMTASGKIVNLE